MRLTIVYRSTKPNGQLTIKMRHYKKGVTDGEIILHYKSRVETQKFIINLRSLSQ